MKKALFLNKLISIGFLLYFLILVTERILAIIFSVNIGGEYALINKNAAAITFYIITVISVVFGTLFFIKPLISIFKTLFSKHFFELEENIPQLIFASMVLLFSGMMHTGFTLPVVQFIAYGFLIIAMLSHTINQSIDKEIRGKSIISFIYLVLFSMAIPVCYLTNLSSPTSIFFYVIEILSTFILIPSFGCMLHIFFRKGYTSNCFIFPIIMIILDGLVIGLKWVDEINYFVLIFLVASTIGYIVYYLYCTFFDRKKN